MPKHATHARTLRASPYLTDSLTVSFHRSAAGMAWRWRTELLIIASATAALLRLRHDLGDWLRPAVLAVTVVLVLALIPETRRFLVRRFWCVLVRHRIHRLCWEARLCTRAGRLPLVLWTRPTKVGERAWLACRAGICAEDFEDRIGELRAACVARDARVTRNTRWSQLVTIDIIRRDTLAATHHIRSPLLSIRIDPPTQEPAEVSAAQVVRPDPAANGHGPGAARSIR
jgi:hypothetical protein